MSEENWVDRVEGLLESVRSEVVDMENKTHRLAQEHDEAYDAGARSELASIEAYANEHLGMPEGSSYTDMGEEILRLRSAAARAMELIDSGNSGIAAGILNLAVKGEGSPVKSYWQTYRGKLDEGIRRGLRAYGITGPLNVFVGHILEGIELATRPNGPEPTHEHQDEVELGAPPDYATIQPVHRIWDHALSDAELARYAEGVADGMDEARFTDEERARLLYLLHMPVPPGPQKQLDEQLIRKLDHG